MDKTIKISFSGPGGLGKSTMCKILSETLGIPWISTAPRDILNTEDKRTLLEGYGYDDTSKPQQSIIKLSAMEPSFGTLFQDLVLLRRSEQIINNNRVILDKSPIDNVAYLLAQGGHNISEDFIQGFIRKAQAVYAELTHVIRVQYSNDIPKGHGHSQPSTFYQKYMSDVFMGVYLRYFANISGPRVIIIDFWDFRERETIIRNFLSTIEPEIPFSYGPKE